MTRVRRMFVVDETMATEGGFIPRMVYEGSAEMIPLSGNGDHAKPWVWGPTLAEAQAAALNYNVSMLRLTQKDMEEISSSVREAGLDKEFPQTMRIVRDGEEALRRMKGYNIRLTGHPLSMDKEIFEGDK
jgi:hypothetical protein